jgi:2,3-bisphosphoglycerate-dependent phosphoglycerate mutase
VSSGTLIVVRHGESEWNALGKWTGTTDVHLTTKGRREAIMLGTLIKDIKIDKAYCSRQIRSLETLESMLNASGQYDVPYERHLGLDERDYGDYTGKNKWEMKQEVGEEVFNKIRRSWDYPVPNGETLKMVYERSVPFYKQAVVPELLKGRNIMLVAHGNSIRSLIKYIESVSDEGISNVEMIFGKALFYKVDDEGKMLDKKEKSIDTTPPPA